MLHTSFATNTLHYNIIWIKYSETCEKLLETHDKRCGTLDQLIPFDTSNKLLSGKFIKVHDVWIRDKPQIKNNWLWYSQYNKTVTCVECFINSGLTDTMKIIIIEPHNFTFINQRDSINGTMQQYNTRYISENCMIANLPFDAKILNETITYMKSNCTGTINHYNSTITKQAMKLDYNGPSYQYKHYVILSKDISKLNCQIVKCNLKDQKKW